MKKKWFALALSMSMVLTSLAPLSVTAGEITQEIEESIAQAEEELENEMAEVGEEVSAFTDEVQEEIAENVSEVQEEIAENVSELEEDASALVSEAEEEFSNLTSEVSEAMEEVKEDVLESVPADEESADAGEGEMDFAAMMAAAAEAAAAKAEEDKAAASAADTQAVAASIYLSGYEWGPGVNKVIFELAEPVESVETEGAIVNTNNTSRVVLDGYVSDEKGEPVEEASKYVTLELETTNSANGSPFNYDFMVTMQNHWAESYPVIALFQAGEGSVGFTGDCIDSRISPETEAFANRGESTGEYVNPMTGETESITLRYAAYEPEALVSDGAKNPLVIWLHGQGEGGTDPDIALLGNEVVALAKEPIQGYFTTEGGEGGAYVLVVQAETYWMDGGDGTNGAGDNESRYTEALMDAIQKYVDGNKDVDTNRIYLGGCSNGGYMTINMLVSYPDYWAAAYPNCEAYAFNCFASTEGDGSAMGGENDFAASDERWMTEEKINAIKDIPIWFAQSADDTVVVPSSFGLPTYQALLKAGAKNVWFSFFETVNGVDDPTAQYMGHWVWCYLFNDKITKVQDPAAIIDAEDELYGFVPSNDGGGSIQAEADGTTYDNIFAWLNAQSK